MERLRFRGHIVKSINSRSRSKTSTPSPVSNDADGDVGTAADGLDLYTDGLPISRGARRQSFDSRQNGSYIIEHTGFEEDSH